MTCCCNCHVVTHPPREFPPAPEPELALPMWPLWTFVALLALLVVVGAWSALS